ncbi:MAG TPA: hypothetical protein VGA71_06265, partial [Actinomycetota bacterium]
AFAPRLVGGGLRFAEEGHLLRLCLGARDRGLARRGGDDLRLVRLGVGRLLNGGEELRLLALRLEPGDLRLLLHDGLPRLRLGERARLREEALVGGASQREADALAATIEVPWGLYALRRETGAAVSQEVAAWIGGD